MSAITVIATICRLAAPFDCHNETVTTSDFAQISMLGCQVGMPQLAEWMRTRPAYRLNTWHCQFGERVKREGI